MKSENYNRSKEMQVDFLEPDSISENTRSCAGASRTFKNVQECTAVLPVKYCALEKLFA